MQATAKKLYYLLEHLEEEDYGKAVSYLEFLIDTRKKEQASSDKATTNTNLVEELASTPEKRQRGFQGLMSYAGTLPEDFDYKKELEEARNEKYARFI